MQDIEYPYNAFVADVFEADEFAQALLDHLRNHPEESKKAPAILDQLHTNFGLDENTYLRLKMEVESIRTAYLALNRLQDAARTAESDNGFVITAFGPQAKSSTEKKSTRTKAATSSKAKPTSTRSPQPITAHSSSTPKTTTKRTRSASTTTKVVSQTAAPVIKDHHTKTLKNSSIESSISQESIMAVEVENEVPAPAEQARQRLSAMAQRGEFNSSSGQSPRIAPPRISARREEIDLLPKNSSIPRKMIWAVVGLVPVAGLVWLMMSYTKINPDLVMPSEINTNENSTNENVANISPALTKPATNTDEKTAAQNTTAINNNTLSDTSTSKIVTADSREENASEDPLLTPVQPSAAEANASSSASVANKELTSNTTDANNTGVNNPDVNKNAPVENTVSNNIPTRLQTNNEQMITPVSERSTVQDAVPTSSAAASSTETTNSAGVNSTANTAQNSGALVSNTQRTTPQQTPSESTSTSQPVEPTWSNPAVVGENTQTQNADVIFKDLSQQAQDLYLEEAEGQGQTALSLLAQLEQANATPDQLRDGYTLVARGYEALSKIYHAQGDRVLSNRYDQQAVLHWRKIQSIPATVPGAITSPSDASPANTSQVPSAPKKPVVEDYSL
ncbi:MAG: hypothetical protein V4629_00650 [Pseudomonadota bacterium]